MAEYLEREALLKSITRECIGCDYAHAIRCVRAEKAADVQPVKHGKFIPFTDKQFYEHIKAQPHNIPFDGECSICGAKMFNTDKYCGECGARMEEGKDD